jgi:hypothetical protein
MENTHFLTSACRYCRYYQPEGRRGGMCQQLGVQVQSEWKACVLASPPFTTTWENLEEIVLLEHSLTLDCSSDRSTIENLNEVSSLAQKEEVVGIANCLPQNYDSDRIFKVKKTTASSKSP